MTRDIMMVLRGRIAVAALAAAAALCWAPGPALADQLVLFKSGKAMRVKSATKDGKWLKCEFEDKNFISVPMSVVGSIEQAALGSTAGELNPTQVAAGSGGGYVPPPRGGNIAPPPEVMPDTDNPPPEVDPATAAGVDEEQQAFQRSRAMEQQAGVNQRNGNVRGIPITPGQVQNQNPAVQGFQPLNQAGTPFQNRRLNQRRGVPGDNLQERANRNR